MPNSLTSILVPIEVIRSSDIKLEHQTRLDIKLKCQYNLTKSLNMFKEIVENNGHNVLELEVVDVALLVIKIFLSTDLKDPSESYQRSPNTNKRYKYYC